MNYIKSSSTFLTHLWIDNRFWKRIWVEKACAWFNFVPESILTLSWEQDGHRRQHLEDVRSTRATILQQHCTTITQILYMIITHKLNTIKHDTNFTINKKKLRIIWCVHYCFEFIQTTQAIERMETFLTDRGREIGRAERAHVSFYEILNKL